MLQNLVFGQQEDHVVIDCRRKSLFICFSALTILVGSLSCRAEQLYTGVVAISPDDSARDVIYKAAHVRPSPRQVAWQELEFEAFIHFGVNAYTDREWGTGKEDPKIFNPARFDADQWVDAFKAATMKGVILTAKHHDGFCMWPSKYTEHSVKNSPWKNGKGDIVAELSRACKRAGIKFAVYLSPWDRHEPTYGDSPRYNDYFCNQLTELLTNYGKISEVWFDGACGEGPNGKRQVYDWDRYYRLIRKLQPDAAISIRGPDVRWCGNEAGRTRQSEWSVLPRTHADPMEGWVDLQGRDLGSREKIKNAKFLFWYPSQVNTSIRPGWFYHASQDDRVKSLEHLLNIYYGSVGGNGQFLLNLPPDRRGLIHENDVARLKQLGSVLRATFKDNLARGAEATASNTRSGDKKYAASNAVDGDKDTYWTTDDWTEAATVEFNLPARKTFNCVMLQEYIKIGQRVEKFTIEARIDDDWKQIAAATVIGYKRLLRFPDVTAQNVRVNFIESRLCPTLSEFGLFQAPKIGAITAK